MITFTRQRLTYDPTTDTSTNVVTTITGNAIQVSGKPDTLRALSLIDSGAPTLLFTPTSYGLRAGTDDFVRAGDTVVWAGATYTVKDVAPVAPDGFVIVARVIVAR